MDESHRPDRVELFRDQGGEWRWHRKAPNGQLIADSGEGYINKDDAVAMAERVNGDDVEYHLD